PENSHRNISDLPSSGSQTSWSRLRRAELLLLCTERSQESGLPPSRFSFFPRDFQKFRPCWHRRSEGSRGKEVWKKETEWREQTPGKKRCRTSGSSQFTIIACLSKSCQGMSKEKARLQFIDMFRGFAVLAMVQAHVDNATILSSLQSQPAFHYLDIFNG